MKKLFIATLAFLMLGCTGKTNNNGQSAPKEPAVEVADTTTVRYLDAPPADYQEGDEFGLVLDYVYYMEVSAWPMPDGDWLITGHWCEEEDGGAWTEDEEGNEGPLIYEDPFEEHPYPVIHKPNLSFNTRNYGGETINFYAAPDSDEILCSTNDKEIGLDVITADLKTRRLLVQNPLVELKGWVDEEWVCGSTVTTCP